ncbi:AraC family transcriptional regulator [bacterium]|nr:MAG: AraC family transcriptional regulator [bacterium]
MDPVEALEECREKANRQELLRRIQRAMPEDGHSEPIEGLYLYRASQRSEPVVGVSEPALCVIAQGSKEIFLGPKSYRYDPDHYLLSTVELPATGQVHEASPDLPYLGLRLQLDSALVGSVMVEAGVPAPRSQNDAKAIVVSLLDSSLLDATLRLVRLIDSPEEVRVLAPLIKREIVFRLLMGEQGKRLRHLAMLGGHSHQIARAVELLRNEFDKPLRVESIAKELGMSTSGFHHRFKSVTDMSPMQFQRQIRLQEAQRLMLGEECDAASAGFRVGYEDASHFSREYKKLFGQSPARDIQRLRSMVRTRD